MLFAFSSTIPSMLIKQAAAMAAANNDGCCRITIFMSDTNKMREERKAKKNNITSMYSHKHTETHARTRAHAHTYSQTRNETLYTRLYT